MKDINKLLDDLKQSGQEEFSVPDGYFENLPHRVMDRIHAEESKPVPLWKWLGGPVLKLTLGAVALFAVSAYFIMMDQPKNDVLSLESCDEVQFTIEDAQMAGIAEDDVISALIYDDIEEEYQEIQEAEYILDNVDVDLLLQEL